MLQTYSVEMFIIASCDDLGFLKERISFHTRVSFGNEVGMRDPAWPHSLTALVNVKTQIDSLKTPGERCEEEESCSF